MIDRHAYSVAAGSRISDEAFGQAGLQSKPKYNKVAGAYIHATNHINKAAGTPIGHPDHIAPHQLQATTWLTRQRLNEHEEKATAASKVATPDPYLPGLQPPKTEAKKAGWGKTRDSSKQRWSSFAQANHPAVAKMFEADEDKGL